MDVRRICASGVERVAEADLPAALARDDGFVWVDVPVPTAEALATLEALGFGGEALDDCTRLNIIPKVRDCGDIVFFIVHGPHRGTRGHVHLLELDVFLGRDCLVTVHGPVGPGVDHALCLEDSRALADALDRGAIPPPATPAALAHLLVSRLTERLDRAIAELGSEIARLERLVVDADPHDVEATLEDLFGVRHELVTCRAIAEHGAGVAARAGRLAAAAPAREALDDITDRFVHAGKSCEVEGEFLAGIVEFFSSRTTARMNLATERLTLIVAVTLPLTVVASVYGMNLIVSESTQVPHLIGVLGAMAAMSTGLLAWARRHGWW